MPEGASADAPDPVAWVAGVFAGFPHTWALCGGWAVDAWLGHPTRAHEDVDVSIADDLQGALFGYLRGWDLVGHGPDEDGTEPWDGRRLEGPGHVHARGDDGIDLEILFAERRDGA